MEKADMAGYGHGS